MCFENDSAIIFIIIDTKEPKKSLLNGGDCFIRFELMEDELERTLHPRALPMLDRFKRIMFNIGIFLKMDLISRLRIKSLTGTINFDYFDDCVINYACMEAGFRFAFAQTMQQDYIGNVCDTIVLGENRFLSSLKNRNDYYDNNSNNNCYNSDDHKKLKILKTILNTKGTFVAFILLSFQFNFVCFDII